VSAQSHGRALLAEFEMLEDRALLSTAPGTASFDKKTGILDVEGTAGSTIAVNATNPTAVSVTISGPNQPKGKTFSQTFSGSTVTSIVVNEPQGGTNTINLASSVATTMNGGTGVDTFNVTLAGSGNEIVQANGTGADLLSVTATASNNVLGLAAGSVSLQNTVGSAAETVKYSGIVSLAISSQGPQTYSGPVVLNTSTALTVGAVNKTSEVTFASTVNGAAGLTVNATGAVNFEGAVGNTTPLSALTAGTSAAVHLDGGSVATTGAQAYNAPVVLGTNDSLAASTFTFASSVDGAAALTITASGGDASFAGPVGGTTPLGGLTIRNARNVNAGAITTAFLAETGGTGTTTLGGPVNTSAGAGVALATNAINVNAAVATTGGGPVTFSNTGLLVIASGGNINASGAVVQNGNGLVQTAGNIYTTGGPVSFATAVTLTGPVSIGTFGGAVTFSGAITGGAGTNLAIDAGAGNVTFASTINGPFALTVASGGTTTFGGTVGGTTPLTRVTTDTAGRTVIGASMSTAGGLTFNDAVMLSADVTLIDAGPGSKGITFNSTIDGAQALTVKSNAPKVFQASIGSNVPLTSLTTAVANAGQPAVPTQINAPVVNTTGDQSYTDAVTLGTATAFNAGGSTTFGGAVSGASGSPITISVTGGVNTSAINLAGATVNTHLQLNNSGNSTQTQNVTVTLGHGTNTFSVTPPSGAGQGGQGGGGSFTGGSTPPPAGVASHVNLIDNGGNNVIDLTQAPLGIALDLGLNDGTHPQSIYQPALSNPNLEEQGAIAGFTQGAVTSLQQSTLNLQGNFQEVIGSSNNLLFAAPPPSAPSSNLAAFSPGSLVVLTGSNNVVYGAPGSTVLSFSGGNQVVGNTTAVNESQLSAYLGSANTSAQAYLGMNTAGQAAYVVQNATGLAQYLATNGAGQAAFLNGNNTAIAQFITASLSGQQAYLSQDSAGVSQYIANNAVAQQAYLSGNSTTVSAFVANNLAAQQAYLATNTPGVSAFIANNLPAEQAYLAQGSAALSAYVAFNATGLSAYQSSAQYKSDPAAQSAFATSGAAGLMSYLLNSSNGALQAYVGNNQAALAQFLNLAPTGIQAYLTASAAGETAYLQQNAPAIAQFILPSPTAQQTYLAQNAVAVAQYIANNAAAQLAYLAGNRAAVTAYIVSNASALSAFLSASEPALQAYAQGGVTALQAYLAINPASISQYIAANPQALSQYLTSSPLILQQYVTTNPTFLPQFLGGNLPALQQYLSANPNTLTQYLGTSPTLIQQYLAGNASVLSQFFAATPGALNQYVLNNPSTLAAYLGASSTLLQQYTNANPAALQQFLTSANAAAIAQYVTANPTVLAQFLATDPTALSQYVGNNPTALVQYLTTNGTALAQYLTANPAVFQQLLTQNPAVFQQYLNQNPSLLQQILASSVLNLFRLKVNLVGSGNDVSGGLLSSFNLGTGLFEETIDPGQLAMVQNGAAAGILPTAYALNVTMAAGSNVIVGGLLGNFTSQGGDTRYVIEDPSLLGLPSGTVIPSTIIQSPGSGGVFQGGGGNDTFYFVGGGNGNAFGHVALAEPAGNAFDTIDLSNFQGGGATLNLNTTTEQTVSPNNLFLTLPSGQGITHVIGSPASDTITANNLNDVLQGEAVDVSHPKDLPGPAASFQMQVVYLDFSQPQLDPSESLSSFDPGGVYSAADQNAILVGLQKLYAPFSSLVQFTLTQPVAGPFETVYFNQTPVVNGQFQPGGHSNEIDFRNLNLSDTVELDVNGFLGTGGGKLPDTEANLVNLSITVAGHEVGHTLGLEHQDAFGPIGFGITNPPGLGNFAPTYDGLVGAFQTAYNVIASPASVGSTLADAASGLVNLGERSAILLAFIEGGVVVNGATASGHNIPATAMPVSSTGGLYTLSVPDPITTGFDAGKSFDVAAVDITDHIGGTQTLVVPDPKNPGGSLTMTQAVPNYYTFYGQAGDLMNFQVMSAALARYQGNSIDSVLHVYDPNGNQIAFNDDGFESSDSSIIDLLLKQTGVYTVEVSSFHATPDQTFFLDPNNPNYNPAAYYGAETGNYELLIYRFNSYNSTGGSAQYDNDTFILGTGSYTIDGGAGTNTVVATAPGSFTLSGSQLITPTNPSSLTNIQQAVLTDSNAAGGDVFTIDQSWKGTATLAGGGGHDSFATTGPLVSQVVVLNSLAAVGVNSDLAGSLAVQGSVPSATIQGNLTGDFSVSSTLGALNIGGGVTNTGVLAAGNINTMTIGPGNAPSAGNDMAGQITVAPTGSLGSLRVSGGAPGAITAGQVGTIGIYGGYGPIVLNVTEGGIQRLVEATPPNAPYPNPVALAPPAPTAANPLPGVNFQLFYEGLASSLTPSNPQLTARVTNQSGNTAPDQFDFSLITFNDQAKFNLARLDSSNGWVSGVRNAVIEGDILTSVSQAASSFLGSGSTLAAGVVLPSDNLAGVGVRDLVPNGSIAAKSIQAVAFGLFISSPQNTIFNGTSAGSAAAKRLLSTSTAIVTAGSLSAGKLETFRVPFADVNPVAFFFDSGANGGSFDNTDVLFSVQVTGSNIAPTASNLARGADTALVGVLQTSTAAVQTIDIRGDNASVQTQQPIATRLSSTGPLGDLSLEGPMSALVIAPSIFGSVSVAGGPLTGTIQTTSLETDTITGSVSTVPGDIGRVFFASGSNVPNVTTIQSTGNGMTGSVISSGSILSQIVASNGFSGIVEAQRNIGVVAGSPPTALGGMITSAYSGTIVSLGNIIGNITIGGNAQATSGNPLSAVIAANGSISGNVSVNGAWGGQLVSLGTLSGTVSFKGGMRGGQVAAKGGITGNVVVSGSIDSASAVVSGAGIGNAGTGTTLSTGGGNNGIIAALGSINASSPPGGFVFANAGGTINEAAVDAIFATGTSPLAPDLFDLSSPFDLVLLKQILQNLKKLKVVTINGVNVLQEGP
jgi:hypothetical protein